MLDEQDQGDAFIAAAEIAVVTEFRAMVDGVAGVLFEDTPFFAKNDARDETFLFAAKQRCAEGTA